MANKSNLVVTWLASMKAEGYTKTQALAVLNKALGTDYKLNTFYEWMRTKYSPGAGTIKFMLTNSLRFALNESGVSNAPTPTQLKKLTEMLAPPLVSANK